MFGRTKEPTRFQKKDGKDVSEIRLNGEDVAYRIIVDTVTGVNYFQVNGGNGWSGASPLLGRDGKVIIDA